MNRVSEILALQSRLIGPKGPFEIAPDAEGLPHFIRGPQTVPDIFRRALTFGNRPFLGAERATHTYDSVLRPAINRAVHLVETGQVRSGQRVGLPPCATDFPVETWMSWFITLTMTGAVVVLLPTGMADPQGLALATGCDAIVSGTPLSDTRTPTGIFVLGAHDVASYDRDAASLPTLSPTQPALVIFTSGSSGQPKAVIHTHRSVTSGLQNMMLGGALCSVMQARTAERRQGGQPVTLHLAPPDYIGGVASLLLTVYLGGQAIVPAVALDALAALALIKAVGVRSVTGLTTDLLRRWMIDENADLCLAGVANLYIHGVSLMAHRVAEVAARWPSIALSTGYGLTETFGTVAVMPAAWAEGASGRVGWLLPGVEVRATNEEGRVLPEGSTGYLEFRGPMLAQRYVDDAATHKAFAEGWYKSCDYGHCYDGFLHIYDRSSRLIEPANGVKVAFSRVEGRLAALPEVDEVVLLRSETGELHLVVGGEGAGSLPSETIRKILHHEFGLEDVATVCLSGPLPRRASGKIDQEALKIHAL